MSGPYKCRFCDESVWVPPESQRHDFCHGPKATPPAAPDEAMVREYERGFRDGYERRHIEVLGALA